MVFAFLAVLLISCSNNIDTAIEKEAIKKVIEKETNSYLLKDVTQRSETFVHNEGVTVLVAGKQNYGYAVGYDQILKSQKNTVEKNPTPSTDTFRNLNYKITVYEKTAWAVYDEMLYNSKGEFIEKVINTRFLEKVDGNWKIVFLGHVNTTSYEMN